MNFTDIINRTAQQLNNSNDRDKVVYPKTKHKKLFFGKDQREILMQVLPHASLHAPFAEPIRKIFLSTKKSNGDQLDVNFVLDADENPGSLLEQKIKEWSDKGMIPNRYGGQQTPRRVYLVNAVKIVKNPANPQQWIQERDEQGNLVVRIFEMPQSAYANLIRKLQDEMYNVSGTEFSFMDVNKACPIKISKPAQGQLEYGVEVYPTIILPPLGQGWENQLEDLKAHAVPTERLENGDKWVQAFIDMKEGRKPNQNQNQGQAAQDQAPAQPQANPYANPFGTAPQQPQTQAQPQPQMGAPTQPNVNPFAGQPVPNVPNVPTQQTNTYATPQAPTQAAPSPTPDFSGGIGEEVDFNSLMPDNMNQAPTQPQSPPEVQPSNPAGPTHNVPLNGNGLMDIEAMLEQELNGGN